METRYRRSRLVGLWHRLGKAAGVTASRVRISPPPQNLPKRNPMRKSDLIERLNKIPGDPEVCLRVGDGMSGYATELCGVWESQYCRTTGRTIVEPEDAEPGEVFEDAIVMS